MPHPLGDGLKGGFPRRRCCPRGPREDSRRSLIWLIAHVFTAVASGNVGQTSGEAREAQGMDEALKARVLAILRSQHMMTLATIRPDGYPQATILNYMNDDLTLYFATDATSQKAGNIRLNNKVSVAIASQTEDFHKLSGLSLSGTAARILDRDAAEELALRLFRTLPQSRRFVPHDPGQLAIFSVVPVAISLIDYASGYGTSHLLEL